MKTLIDSVFELLSTIFTGLFDVVSFIFNINTNEKLYDNSEMDNSTRRRTFSRFNKGLLINGKKRITLKQTLTHALIVGASGRGKTSSFFIPNLLSAKNQSFIITDLDGSMYEKCSGYLTKQGYDIQVLNLDSVTHGEFFNPIVLAENEDELKALCEQIISSSDASKGSDKFWEFSAISLMFLLTRLVKLQASEHQNLTNVRHLLSLMETKEFPEFVANCASGSLWNDYLSFQTKDVKLRTNIQASLSATLDLFAYSELSHVTSKNTIDFERLTKPKSVMFIIIPERKLARYSLLISVFYAQLFEYVQANRPKKPLLFLLDEAGAYKIKNLNILLSILRRYNCSVSLGIQDLSQFKHMFGQDSSTTIINNASTKIIFPGASLSLANEVSRMAGQTSVEILFEGKIRQQNKPVLSVTDVIQMKQNKALILVSNLAPVILSMYPYFKQFILKRRSRIKPIEFKSNSLINPQLINLSNTVDHEEN
jgi:type IV secretion system protein VirD4